MIIIVKNLKFGGYTFLPHKNMHIYVLYNLFYRLHIFKLIVFPMHLCELLLEFLWSLELYSISVMVIINNTSVLLHTGSSNKDSHYT